MQSAEVPKLFKHSGKIRNKHLSKRDTEKLVKEIWKERMADPGGWVGACPPARLPACYPRCCPAVLPVLAWPAAD